MSDEYNVALQMKIYVEDPEKLNSVKESLGNIEGVKLQKVWEEDIGFGIKVLKALFLMKDSEGGTDALEGKVRGIENVKEVEIESVGRV